MLLDSVARILLSIFPSLAIREIDLQFSFLLMSLSGLALRVISLWMFSGDHHSPGFLSLLKFPLACWAYFKAADLKSWSSKFNVWAFSGTISMNLFPCDGSFYLVSLQSYTSLLKTRNSESYNMVTLEIRFCPLPGTVLAACYGSLFV